MLTLSTLPSILLQVSHAREAEGLQRTKHHLHTYYSERRQTTRLEILRTVCLPPRLACFLSQLFRILMFLVCYVCQCVFKLNTKWLKSDPRNILENLKLSYGLGAWQPSPWWWKCCLFIWSRMLKQEPSTQSWLPGVTCRALAFKDVCKISHRVSFINSDAKTQLVS